MRAIRTCAVFCALSVYSPAGAHTAVHYVPIIVGVPRYTTRLYSIAAPTFPVTVKEAKVKDVFRADTDNAIYDQEFLPRSVVKIDEPLTVPFIASQGVKADRPPVILPAGSVFVEASYASRQVYCASVKQSRAWLLVDVPLGICLYDPNNSGKFTQMIYFPSGTVFAQQYAYEVVRVNFGDNAAPSADISVAYESVPVDESFASKIEIRIDDSERYSKTQKWQPILQIAPRLMTTPSNPNVTAVANFVGSTQRQVVNATWFYKDYRPADAQPLTFGWKISVGFKAKSEGSWDLSWNGTLPAGEYFLHTVTTSGVFEFATTERQYVNLPPAVGASPVALPNSPKPPSLGVFTDYPTLPKLNLKDDPPIQQ